MKSHTTFWQFVNKSTAILSLLFLLSQFSLAQTPFIQKVSGNNCVGGGQIFVLQGVSGCSSINWSATGGGVVTSLGSPESIQVVWNSTQTSASVTATYSYCSTGGSGSKSLNSIQIYEGVTPTISLPTNGNYDVCSSGGNISFSATSSDEGSSPSYSWYVNNSFNKSTTTSSTTISVVPGDQVKVTMYSDAPCANPTSVTSNTITIQQKDVSLPSNAYVADAAYCGSETGAQVVVQNASAGYQHKIYRVGGSLLATAYPNASGMIYFGPYASGTYNVYAINDCNEEVLVGSSVITYNPNPGGNATPSPGLSQSFCDGNPGTLTITAGNGSNYKWYIDNSPTPYSTSSTLTYPFSHETYGTAGSHTVSLSYNVTNTCGTSVPVQVTGMPVNIDYAYNPTVSIQSLPASVCPATTVNLMANPSDAGTDPDYLWTVGSETFTSRSFDYEVTEDVDISVQLTSNESCFVTDAVDNESTSISVYLAPTSGQLYGPTNYCPEAGGAQMVIQNTHDDYIYYLYRDGLLVDEAVNNGGAAFFALQTIIGTYTAKAAHDQCEDDIVDLPGIVELGLPISEPAVSIQLLPQQTATYCSNETITFRALIDGSDIVGGSNYLWNITGKPQISTSSNSVTIDLNEYTSGDYSMTMSFDYNYGCGTKTINPGFSVPFTVNEPVPVSVSISTTEDLPVCKGIPVRYDAVISPSEQALNFDYQWKVNGSEVGSNLNYYSSSDFNMHDKISCEITLKAGYTMGDLCISDIEPVSNIEDVLIHSIPAAPNLGGFENSCGETDLTITAVTITSLYGTDITHRWYDSNDDEVTEGTIVDKIDENDGTLKSTWDNNFTSGETYYVTAANECGTSQPSLFTISTGSIPSVSLTAFACSPSYISPVPLTIYFENAPPGSSYAIYRHSINQNGNDIYNFIDEVTSNTYVYSQYTLDLEHEMFVILKDPNNCDPGNYRSIYIENISPSAPIISGDYQICSNTDLELKIENLTGGDYNWFLDPNNDPISNSQIYTQLNVTSNVTLYASYVKNGNIGSCTSDIATINVEIIDEQPDPPVVPLMNKRCNAGDIEISAFGSFERFEWYDANDNLLENQSNKYVTTLSQLDVPVPLKVKGVLMEGCESELIEFTAQATSNCENYIHETTIIENGHLPGEDLIPLDINIKDDNWTYFDGLGRNMQSVAQQSTPDGNDLVQPVIYDEHGREIKTYLPYVQIGVNNGYYRSNPVKSGDETTDYHDSPQYQFYETHFGATVDDPEYPYAQKRIEASPLGRILEEAAPGKYWHFGATDDVFQNPTSAQIQYNNQTNGSDEIPVWVISESELVDNFYQKLTVSENPEYYDPKYYDPDELWINIVDDENGNMSCEYKDKQGKVVLKKVQVDPLASITSHDGWACTYYVYDDFGNLRYVLPPQAVQLMVDQANWALVENIDFLKNWLFYYQYDDAQRMAIKKVPGAEPVYMVYDIRDRLILTQDGNQRSTVFGDNTGKQWIFTKYDALNRPIMTGIYTHNGPEITQADMQRDVVNVEIATGTDFYEEPDVTKEHGYSNQMFPTTNTVTHSVTYYDNYSFLGQSWFDAENLSFDYDNSLNTTLQPSMANSAVKGQVTGSKVKVLDPDEPDGVELFLNTVTYYDDRYRVIQTITENHLGSTERSTSCFDDLSANVKESYITSTMTDAPSVHRKFHYDHAQRLEYVEHSIDGGDYVKTVENYYNELGELIKKDLHQENGNVAWQSVDYQYNIRGWLTHINDAVLTGETGVNPDLFGMELYYASGFDVPMYNGNISGVKWKSAVDDDRMAYGYTYDKLNRIVSADYVKGTNPIAWEDEGYYNMEIRGEPIGDGLYASGYDLNGNILNLKRYGVVDKHQAAIDVLTYDYANGNSGNQLRGVSDGGTNEGFKDGTTDFNSDGRDYLYDANGNMIADDNKEIENIVYNFMNLPMVIDMTDDRKIEYIYDAAGIKLAQRVFKDDTKPVTKVTDYIGERVYETMAGSSQELQFLHHEEGRIVPGSQLDDPDWTPDAPDWEYQYHLKDHLGNTRLTFGASTEDVFTLTMEVVEPENRIIEDREFENVTISEDNRLPDHNHTPVVAGVTPDPEYVVKLDGVTKVIGPAKSFEVLPGDEINIDVWAKYLHAESYDPSVAAEALLSGFLGAFINYGSEMLITKGYVDGPLLTGLENIPTGKNYSGVPEAYINYIVFDKNYDVVVGESKKLRISDEGKYGDGSLGTHEHLVVPPINITKAGYIYIYLSNHTPLSEVIFDDLTIKHTHGKVIQKNDYYPFGLSIAALSSQRDNSVKNKWTFQDQESQDDFDLGWYAFKWRNHQPEIGRFFNVDPLAEKYNYNSTYAFSENRVIDGIELEGLEWKESTGGDHYRRMKTYSFMKPIPAVGEVGYIHELPDGSFWEYTGEHEFGSIQHRNYVEFTQLTIDAVAASNPDNSQLTILNPDGTISNYSANADGMVELPYSDTEITGAGTEGFYRFNGITYYSYYNRNDVNGAVEDQWGEIQVIEGLFNSIMQYRKARYSSGILGVGDMRSPRDGRVNVNLNSTHHGNRGAVDIRYIGHSGNSYRGLYNDSRFSPENNRLFISIMGQNGFNRVFVAPQVQNGLNSNLINVMPDYSGVHDNHLHFDID